MPAAQINLEPSWRGKVGDYLLTPPMQALAEFLRQEKAKGKGRVTYERGFHSLRHTFTSWLRNAGVSEEDRMALTGHSTRESHAIYSHHDEAALRDAVAKLPSITGN